MLIPVILHTVPLHFYLIGWEIDLVENKVLSKEQ